MQLNAGAAPSISRTPRVAAGGPSSRWALPAAALSGVMMVLAFPRYGQDWLIWVTLAPLFWAALGAGARRGFLAGWLAGITLVAGGFQWVLYSMRAFTGMGRWADAALFTPWVFFESLPWAILGLFLGLLRSGGRPAPAKVFWAIPLWVGLEHHFPHIFAWHVGGALHDRGWLVQAADIFGVSGLTALVLLVNAVVYLGITSLARRERLPFRSAAVALALLAAVNLYGWVREGQVERAMASAPDLRVGIVQPVADPGDRRPGDETFLQKMVTLTRILNQGRKADLVVWPEGADTRGYIFDLHGKPGRPKDLWSPTGLENVESPLVAGSWSHNLRTRMGRNTAAFFLPGKWPPAGFYHKNIRVLFGEYIPFHEHLPSVFRSMIENAGTIEAGRENPLLTLPAAAGSLDFRILICYEAILSGYVRRNAQGADFLVNPTEDIWYGRTSHVGQHLSVLKLRAVENRISIVRAANAGPSGVIDPAGRMRERTEPFEKSEKVVSLRPARLHSFHARAGFLFPSVCLAAGVVIAVRQARARKN